MSRIATLTFVLTASAFAAPSTELLTAADEKEVRAVALGLREAILQEDLKGITRVLSKSGLTCTDTRIPYHQVVSDLHNKNSHLYLSLFDSARFSRQCGKQYSGDYPAISEKEFFATAPQERMEIKPLEPGWAKVMFRSEIQNHYPREWFFHKEGGRWRFADGFVLSRCTCG